MTFLWIAAIAQFFYAFAFIGDKFVIEKTIRHPSVFTFLINIVASAGILF